VITLVVLFVAVNAGVLVLPLAARPMAVLEFVQVKVAPAGLLTKVLAGTASPAQNVRFGSATTVGAGLIVIVYVIGVPAQPPSVGVTVTVPVIALDVAFVVVKEGVLVLPLAARPMPVFEFVHVNVAPVGLLTKVLAGAVTPGQKLRFASATTVGIGFTVIVYVLGVPTHPARVGVIVIVPVIALPVPLVAVNEGVLVLPLAARPIAVLEFVQVNVAPVGLLVNVFAGTVAPAQTEILDSATTVGKGLTVTVTVPAGPTQPPTEAVTEYVPVVVIPVMVGFWREDEKPPGPVQL
jgi:hypothetical protein